MSYKERFAFQAHKEQLTAIFSSVAPQFDTSRETHTVTIPDYLWESIQTMQEKRHTLPFYYLIILHKGFYIDETRYDNSDPESPKSHLLYERHPNNLSIADFESLFKLHEQDVTIPYVPVSVASDKDTTRKINYMHIMLHASIIDKGNMKVWKIPQENDTSKKLFFLRLLDYIDLYQPNPQPFLEEHHLRVAIPDPDSNQAGFNHLTHGFHNLGIDIHHDYEQIVQLLQLAGFEKSDKSHDPSFILFE